MRLLLDTQVVLWAASEAERLSCKVRRAIENPTGERYLSAASVWELSIKAAAGRVELPVPLEPFVRDLEFRGVRFLPVEWGHAVVAGNLPPVHKDPFDRMLVAQALVEDLTLVTADRTLKGYQARVLW
jgi:PIN domain nuclease of toxin-antitoxin system